MPCPRGRANPLFLILFMSILMVGGCTDNPDSIGQFDRTWGRRGISDGRLQKPRAIAIDSNDRLYIVDMLARIQVFDGEGNLLLPSWKTPLFKNGKPTGLSISRNGNLMVADTHYYRVLFYTPDGKLLEKKTIGGTAGHGPGQFGLVTDVVEDSKGNYYVSEYGDFDRIQKFSPSGQFLLQWGSHGDAPGQFRRPQNMTIDSQDRIWVVDACNHRVQVFDTQGKLLTMWGTQGQSPGQLFYPYDIVLNKTHVYICEYGNNRIQKFTQDGQSIGCWGQAGRQNGELHNPWALVQDSGGRLFVVDTNNHRVQQIRM